MRNKNKSSQSTPSQFVMSSTSLVLIMTLFKGSACAAAPAQVNTAFTAVQQTQIEEIAEQYLASHPGKIGEVVATYLAEHPEFLVAAGESLRQRQQISQQQAFIQRASQYQEALLDKTSPSVGAEDAKAAVVMFFDYQCSYCSKMAPVVATLIKENPDVRFVFKEYPIFSSRWPVSLLAARVGEKIWQNNGAEAYLSYHNAIFSTGKIEGQLTEKDVHIAAQRYLSDSVFDLLSRSQGDDAITIALQKNVVLAQQINFTGTPAFIAIPQGNGNVDKQISVFQGSTTEEMLQMAIQKAKG